MISRLKDIPLLQGAVDADSVFLRLEQTRATLEAELGEDVGVVL